MENMKEQKRLYQYDNMRLLLILLVVTGHEMELFRVGKVDSIYRIIYTFHMPFFLYLTGKFAKFDRKKVFRHLIIPYFLFQTIYLCFEAKVMTGSDIILQYTTPYWILWYLFATIIFYLFIPMLPRKGTWAGYGVLAASILISLLAGYDDSIGRYLSLSRILVFAPFFVWGYYDEFIRKRLAGMSNIRFWKSVFIGISILAVVATEIYVYKENVPLGILYGSVGYQISGGNVVDRAVVMLAAVACIILLNMVVPKRKIPVITSLGQNTMPIFLLHAFFIRLAAKYELFHYAQWINSLLACVFGIVIIGILGNGFSGKIFRKVF